MSDNCVIFNAVLLYICVEIWPIDRQRWNDFDFEYKYMNMNKTLFWKSKFMNVTIYQSTETRRCIVCMWRASEVFFVLCCFFCAGYSMNANYLKSMLIHVFTRNNKSKLILYMHTNQISFNSITFLLRYFFCYMHIFYFDFIFILPLFFQFWQYFLIAFNGIKSTTTKNSL